VAVTEISNKLTTQRKTSIFVGKSEGKSPRRKASYQRMPVDTEFHKRRGILWLPNRRLLARQGPRSTVGQLVPELAATTADSEQEGQEYLRMLTELNNFLDGALSWRQWQSPVSIKGNFWNSWIPTDCLDTFIYQALSHLISSQFCVDQDGLSVSTNSAMGLESRLMHKCNVSTLRFIAFWDVTSCSLVDDCQHSRETVCLHLQGWIYIFLFLLSLYIHSSR
jgi:hypothetical protein